MEISTAAMTFNLFSIIACIILTLTFPQTINDNKATQSSATTTDVKLYCFRVVELNYLPYICSGHGLLWLYIEIQIKVE